MEDTAYQQFKKNYFRKVPEGLELLISKLSTQILKHDRAHKEIYELKYKMADAIQLAKKVGKEADDAHKKVVTIAKDLEFTEWKVKQLEALL